MNAEMIAAIVKQLIIYGPGAVISIAAAFQNGKPTVEQILALQITRDPEEYF